MSDTVIAAIFGALGGIVVSVVGWLATLSAQNRARQNSIDLAERESTLRVRADVQLKLHDKAWGLLREIAELVRECHGGLATILARAVEGKSIRQELTELDVPFQRLYTLAAIVPPKHKVEDVASAIGEVYSALLALKHGTPVDSDWFSKFSDSQTRSFANARKTLGEWNAELWETAERLGENETTEVLRARKGSKQIACAARGGMVDV